jgi:hypothetical protein
MAKGKQDPESKKALETLMQWYTDPAIARDYLINVITYPKYRNMTIEEVLDMELESMKGTTTNDNTK